MGLFDKIKKFIDKQMVQAKKDNVLVSAIYHIMVEDLGWKPKKVNLGVDVHEMEFYKPGSPLTELDIKAERSGGKLYLKFEGELKYGGALGSILEDLFDIDMEREIKYNLALNLSEFVNENLEVINEGELKRMLNSYISMIEERAGKIRS